MAANSLWLFFLIGLVIFGLLAFYLWRMMLRLRVEMNSLKAAFQASKSDVAALCQAGVCQDNRISEQGQKLQELTERIEHLGERDPTERSFHAAIAAARKGADVQDLIDRYGITRDAAELLIRLHGSALGCEG